MVISGLRGRLVKLNGKEIEQRFNQLLNNKKFTCTADEFDLFVNYGLLIKSGKKYVTRNNSKVNLDVIETKTYNMTINLSNIISNCEVLCKNANMKRIYCMTNELYNKYEKLGLILVKGDNIYYRLFENELWLVYII